MLPRRRWFVAAAFFVGAAPSVASAMLMTFDALPNEGAQLKTWTEDGITATAEFGVIATTLGSPGSVHLDGWGTGHTSRIEFTTGGLFTPGSAVIRAGAADFCAAPCEHRGIGDDPFPYISITGFLGDTLVGSLLHYGDSGAFEILLSSLGQVDRLTIGVNGSLYGEPDPLVGFCGFDHGCGHFSLDSVQVSVPEPETLLLLIPGVVALLLGRRRGPAS